MTKDVLDRAKHIVNQKGRPVRRSRSARTGTKRPALIDLINFEVASSAVNMVELRIRARFYWALLAEHYI